MRRAFKINLGFHIWFFCGYFLFFNDIQKVKEIALHVLQWGVLRYITESKKHIIRLLMNEVAKLLITRHNTIRNKLSLKACLKEQIFISFFSG